MCHPVQCPRCGKTGWAGCGQHVDSVMKNVPAAQRCTCREVPDDDPCDLGCQIRPRANNLQYGDPLSPDRQITLPPIPVGEITTRADSDAGDTTLGLPRCGVLRGIRLRRDR